MQIIVVLDNIRSTYNVGAILRSCEGFGVSEVVLSGYTPRVNDPNLLPHLREKLNREIHKTALGAEEMLTINSSDNILTEIKTLKSAGWQIVGLENNIVDERLLKLNSATFKDKLLDKVVLILGEEVHGIDHALFDAIDLFAEIPMHGKKESFNVSVAAGIALYAIIEA